MFCKVYVPESKRITCGLLEVLQFQKSCAGEDTAFPLKWGEFSDLFSFRSFDGPFKAWAGGDLVYSGLLALNEKLV